MLMALLNLLTTLVGASAFATAPPPASEKAKTARWMVSSMTWGTLTTISSRANGSTVGDAFGNPYSFADASDGVPYFFVSDLDASMIDLFGAPHASPRASLALSEATLQISNGSMQVPACDIGIPPGDPENPPCARLTLSGEMQKLAIGSDEEAKAKAALFSRHPSFQHYPKDHKFYVTKLVLDGIWLIDEYGGAAIIKPADYFAASVAGASAAVIHLPPREPVPAKSSPPPFWEKVATARWMAKSLNWGVLSTVSTRAEGTVVGDPFGNPYSFADVEGQPYYYASDMDASMIDLFVTANHTSRATFTVSEASLTGALQRTQSCKIGTYLGDPENPPCARLVFSGAMIKLTPGTSEETIAKKALFDRHPSFVNLPVSHGFYVAKLQLDNIWLIDIFGGASFIAPKDYFAKD